MNVSRRAFLRQAAVTPIAGAVVAKQALMPGAGGLNGILAGSGMGGISPPTAGSPTPTSFTSFAKWFSNFGDEAAKNEAQYVNGFDPEIIELRLPLQTKVRMQRKRNYIRVCKEKKSWFTNTVKREGKVDWWS